MPEKHRQPLVAGPSPATPYDIWIMPFVFWANWWSFCEQALHVTQTRLCPAESKEQPAGDSVDIEVEEGLVA